MIVLSNNEDEILGEGHFVIFDRVVLHTGVNKKTGKSAERNQMDKRSVALRGGLYEVTYNCNVTSDHAGDPINMVLTLDWDPLRETIVHHTVYESKRWHHIAVTTIVGVPMDEVAMIAVKNLGPTTMTLAKDSCMTIRRVA